MKRARFLSITTAAGLAGCSGHAAGVLPAAPAATGTSAYSTQLAALAESRVSALQLSRPVIGEVAAFAGKVAPAGWEFATGQLVPIAQNRPLFSILGTSCGGDGKTTFGYPHSTWVPLVVAVAGTFPSSPDVLAKSGVSTYSAQLGPGAQPARVTMPAPESPELIAQRELAESASSVRPGRASAIDSDVRDRVRASVASARVAALAALAPATAARVNALVASAVAGGVTLGGVAAALRDELSPAEAASLLAISDATDAPFRGGAIFAHPAPAVEAAQYLVSVALTPEQIETIADNDRLNKIVNFHLPADDVERAAAFYRDVFGWEFGQQGDPAVPYLVSDGEGDASAGIPAAIVARQGYVKAPVPTVEVEHIDRAMIDIAMKGGQQGRVADISGIGRFGYALDSEGNTIALVQRETTAPA